VSAERLDRIKVVSERLLAAMRVAARREGWALAVHGSMTRDLDLVAVPWTDTASYEPAFVEAMRAAVAAELGGVAVVGAGDDGRTSGFKIKPNGRRSWTLHSTSEQLVEDEHGAHPYVDLCVMDFRLSAVGHAFSDGVYAACSALENTDRMADDLVASAWPAYADQYAALLPSPLPAPPGTTRAPADLRSALEAETIERCAAIADSHVALGYMSGRERDYCHEHGDEIAEKIRALAPTKEPAA
jgi:hypothetical protein